MAAAQLILNRANEAVGKEQRLTAVADLQGRVEDWKGHRIDHFGELLEYGLYPVVKGEGAKSVEREVCEIFNTLNPYCCYALCVASLQLPPVARLHRICRTIYRRRRQPSGI